MFAKVYKLERKQTLPISRNECWEFFSTPRNLPRITPPWLGFDIGDLPDETARAGQIFQYRVRPMLGIPLTWVSEITHLVPLEMFVDEQRFGPYRFWHHQHLFRDHVCGTEVIDIVHYALPFGVAGRIVNHLSVAKKLAAIFDYRRQVLDEMFGTHRDTRETAAPKIRLAVQIR